MILSFRDLTSELTGLDRFIPLRSDATRIFMCFLEYEKEHVKVHDVVYEKSGPRWKMKKSFFRKLRIFPHWAKECLLKAGFKIESLNFENETVTVIAHKPPG